MLQDWIDLIALRKFMTTEQKWFMIIFYTIICSILLIGKFFLLGLKIFCWFFGLLTDRK